MTKIMTFLKVSHNPELVNLFFIHVLDELIGCTLDVLTGSNRTPDNKNIGTGFQRILHDIHPHATRQLRQGVFRPPPS